MDVLVAGGTGFIGRALCRVLVDRGHEVTAASRTPDADGLPAAVETVVADVSDSDLEEDAFGFALPALLAVRLLED